MYILYIHIHKCIHCGDQSITKIIILCNRSCHAKCPAALHAHFESFAECGRSNAGRVDARDSYPTFTTLLQSAQDEYYQACLRRLAHTSACLSPSLWPQHHNNPQLAIYSRKKKRTVGGKNVL